MHIYWFAGNKAKHRMSDWMQNKASTIRANVRDNQFTSVVYLNSSKG